MNIKGLFKSEKVMSTNVAFRGFTKREGRRYVAVCIDLDIVAQGDTPEQATKICGELISEYVAFVIENHPKEIGQFIPRPAPQEIIDEYNLVVRQLMAARPMSQQPKAKSPKHTTHDTSVASYVYNRENAQVCLA